MSEQTNAYQSEVRRIAELLHATWWKHDKDGIPHFGTVITTPEIWDQARAMVAEMAEHVRKLAIYSPDLDESDYLIDRGLIPAPRSNKSDPDELYEEFHN